MTVESTLILFVSLRDLAPSPARISCQDPEWSAILRVRAWHMGRGERDFLCPVLSVCSQGRRSSEPWETFAVRKPVSSKHVREVCVSTQGCSFFLPNQNTGFFFPPLIAWHSLAKHLSVSEPHGFKGEAPAPAWHPREAGAGASGSPRSPGLWPRPSSGTGFLSAPLP